MKVVYAGTTLGAEPPQSGTDTLQGFALPKAKQQTEWAEGLRSEDAEPMGRMNRQRTITGIVIPMPGMTFGQAMAARTQFYETLAFEGALVLMEDTQVTTFAQAVLADIDVVKAATFGVSYGLQFTFDVGPPAQTNSTSMLGDGRGNILGDGRGNALGDGN